MTLITLRKFFGPDERYDDLYILGTKFYVNTREQEDRLKEKLEIIDKNASYAYFNRETRPFLRILFSDVVPRIVKQKPDFDIKHISKSIEIIVLDEEFDKLAA